MKKIYFISVLFILYSLIAKGQYPSHPPHFPEGSLDAGMIKVIQDPDKGPLLNADGSWTMHFRAMNAYFIPCDVDNANHQGCDVIENIGSLDGRDIGLMPAITSVLSAVGNKRGYDQKFSLNVRFEENSAIYISFPEPTAGAAVMTVLMPILEPVLFEIAGNFLKDTDGFKRFEAILLEKIKGPAFTSGFSALSEIEFRIENAEVIKNIIVSGFEVNLPLVINEVLNQLRQENFDVADFSSEFVANFVFSAIVNKLTNEPLIVDLIFGMTKSVVGAVDLATTDNLVFCSAIEFKDNKPQFQSLSPLTGQNIAAGDDVNLEWSFSDLDGDDLVYDLFIQAPEQTSFIKVNSTPVTDLEYFYSPFVNGLYLWKVVARYPWNALIRKSSPVYAFEVGCPTHDPIVINTSDFEMLCNSSGFTYDLKFAFVGGFDSELDYQGTFSYTDDEGQVIATTIPIVPNVSDPQNIVQNLPNDKSIDIIVTDGCNTSTLLFNPYPDIEISKDPSSCSMEFTLLENGSISSYDIEIDDVETSLNNTGDTYTSSFSTNGFKPVVVRMSPEGSDCIFQRVFTFTCLEFLDEDCPEFVSGTDTYNCENSTISIDMTGFDDEFFILEANNGGALVLDGSIAEIPFISNGSPEVDVRINKGSILNCLSILQVNIDCPISDVFLSQEEQEAEELVTQAEFCGLHEGYFDSFKSGTSSEQRRSDQQDIPSALIEPIQHLSAYQDYIKAKYGYYSEIYRSIYLNESFGEYKVLTNEYVNNFNSITSDDSTFIVSQMSVFDIDNELLRLHIEDWNVSLNAWNNGIFSATDSLPNILNKANIDYHLGIIDSIQTLATSEGFTSPETMYESATEAINDYSLEDDPNENAVCASVSINLSQTLTMTREAFEGTLTIFNGSTDGAMDSVELELIILDSDGVVSNDLFEIETTGTNELTAIDGTGVLDADTEGTATVLFIPEPGAAPTVPRPYSFGGNLSYIDPFSGLRVTMPLVPVTLTVNPSPDMFLHYFLERDVLGDDIFTSEVEPSIPAKLGLMIENNGYGEATNVRIESAQPQVIDNENGLALNMNLIGTRLQGEDANMGLTNINFGNINPLSTKVGEWLFTSNLLGHFTGYETNLVHSDSRGNPDLSLISGLELHELIRSINVYGGLDDGIEDFLVNEVPDANDHPDAIYLTQGNTVYDVAESFVGEFIGAIQYPEFTNTLSFDPVDSLWNYIELDDPGEGNFEIVSVTRDGDGFRLPLTNAWLTYVTIPDSKVQVYENKFHIVDDVLSEEVQTYTVVWTPKDPNPPAVDTIIGAPESLAYVPVTTLDIVFTEEIVDSTFTYEDISLIRAGGNNLLDSTISIIKIDSVTYQVDISDYTLEDGYYVFTCQAAGVTDLTGSPGTVGKQVSWTQTLASPAIISFDPDIDGQVITSIDSLTITFNISIDTATFDMTDIDLLRDGTSLDLSSLELGIVDNQFQVFKLTNLSSVIDTIGGYTIHFDLPNISSTTNKQGASIQSINFTYDNSPPEIISITKIYDGGLDHQHVTGLRLIFNEEISELNPASIQLIRDNVDVSILPINVIEGQNNSHDIFWEAIKSYPDGMYDFEIDMALIEDLGGNVGSGISEKSWLVDRIPSLVLDGLSISPDYGFSDSDGLTYNRTFDFSFQTNEYANDIVIYQDDNGELIPMQEIDELEVGVHTYNITLLTGGNTSIKITAKDSLLNYVEASLAVNIDETPLTGAWEYTSGSQVLAHLDSLIFTFTKPVLDTENIPSGSISLTKDNVPVDISSLSFTFTNNTTLEISDLMNLDSQFGTYVFQIDLTQYYKYSSGISGYSTKETSYNLFDPNKAPVAIASQDTVVQTGDIVTVTGIDSYDPDGDELSYLWFAPDGITLSDSTIASPSFLITNEMAGEVITLLLSVSDGSKVSTDIVRVYVSADDILVAAKMLLQGPYDESTGKMSDLLRSQSKIPLIGPYVDSVVYEFGEEKSVDPLVLSTTDDNNVVDWVYIELIDMANDSAVAGGMYLLRQEGDIVDVDGVSPPKFSNIPEGSYSLAIYHRNHLPIRTNENLVIETNSIKNIDLTQNPDQILGTINAVYEFSGTYTMFAGDVDGNGQIQQSDINQTRPKIGLSGYLIEDVNMNGEVQNTDIQNLILPNLGRGKQF